ncbi:hypothetical protein KR51_00028520 [Rubidibacter lacunae KORDI 51-2]|uniref:Uncharacterized protein n=1 Tax=Rubidibacter lacunae KORDI 51-2 TaxID=582515 RepID=U5DLM6_9CHRO|nr:hypothetical protein [Rubidibacter lacunae]ERN40595.1 hypothetical protein KR51_00028520 [Rubidibacter lacunae KORDI 51-2]
MSDSASPVDLPARASSSPKLKPSRGIQPTFRTLIVLTLVVAALLTPFAFSAIYLDYLRDRSIDLHTFLRGEIYKQTTGYIALAFLLFEVLLAARKRGRGWVVKVKLPGTLQFWRRLHIFLGVGLVGMVLVHTLGVNGLNFNAIFLWVFFAVTLSALVGVVAESGVLESSRRVFLRLPGGQVLTKGPLIRGMRAIWLSAHIFLVSIFSVLSIFHIALAYYYQ